MARVSQPAVITDIATARTRVRERQTQGLQVGLVPTMGALHEGHLSLVQASAARCDSTVVTIFVNPTQFGPNEDFDEYPRTLEDDLALLEPLGVDFVFAPERELMYPPEASTAVTPPTVAERLEGAHRPGHFSGVCTIVLKLFQILPADSAFFGQKDYQQAAVIRQMTADLNLPIEINVEPIIRDADGLALSSRNRYLSDEERSRALTISRSLQDAKRRIESGERSPQRVIDAMHAQLNAGGVERIDYATLADPQSLAPVADPVRGPVVALIAAHVGSTRLIDNCIIEGASTTSLDV